MELGIISDREIYGAEELIIEWFIHTPYKV